MPEAVVSSPEQSTFGRLSKSTSVGVTREWEVALSDGLTDGLCFGVKGGQLSKVLLLLPIVSPIYSYPSLQMDRTYQSGLAELEKSRTVLPDGRVAGGGNISVFLLLRKKVTTGSHLHLIIRPFRVEEKGASLTSL